MLRLGLLVALLAFLCACTDHNVRDIDEVPERPADYSALYFSSPTTERVLVTSIISHSLRGDRGMGVQGGATMPEPLWLWPDWWQVTYACPGAYQAFFTATIGLSQHGKYFLHCAADNRLMASRLVEP
jgi:hypothetical protein